MISSYEEKSFTTYLNYVVAISKIFPEDAADDLQKIDVSSIKKISLNDKKDIKKLLYLAWSTENILNEAHNDECVVVYANLWSTVQLYYAIFSIMRAYLLLFKCTPKDHVALMNAIVSKIESKDYFIGPWKTIYMPKKREFSSLPRGVKINREISNLTRFWNKTPSNCWSLFYKFSNSTLSKLIDKKYYDSKKSKTRKLITQEISPICLLHLLYRLRCRSNYQDGDAFIKGTNSVEDAKIFIKEICNICYNSFFNFEYIISRYLSTSDYSNIVNEYKLDMERLSQKKQHNCVNRLNIIKGFSK